MFPNYKKKFDCLLKDLFLFFVFVPKRRTVIKEEGEKKGKEVIMTMDRKILMIIVMLISIHTIITFSIVMNEGDD